VFDTTLHKTHDENKLSKNTAQYVLDTTLYTTQDEDTLNKKHSTICVGHHLTQDTRRRQAKYKNTAQ